MYSKLVKNNGSSSLSTVSVKLDKCPRCSKGTKVTDNETGEIVCSSCGLVISEKIEDHGAEHRNFADGSVDKRRTGAGTALSRHDMGLATIINPANKDATGKALTSSMKYSINRLRYWDLRSQTQKSSDRNFRIAFTELEKLKDKLGLPDAVMEKTAYIYRKAIAKNIVRGRSISALLGASLYAACRDAETPRTLKDIEGVANIKRKELAKCYRVLVEKLDMRMPVINCAQWVTRIASNLGVNEQTKRMALNILKDYEQTGDVAGKSPTGLAATALYLACVKMGEFFTQRQVAKAANVTEVTIRNRSAAIKKTWVC